MNIIRGRSKLLFLAIMSIGVCDIAFGEDNNITEGYGIVSRKQDASKRVIFQPIEGSFKEGTELSYYDQKGEPLCKGRVQSVYRDEVFSVVDECDKFDSIKKGLGVASNGSAGKIIDIYNNREKYDMRAREREWDRIAGVPMEIGEDQFDSMVKKSTLPVLVEFYATWCPVCTRFGPILGEVAKDLEGKVRIATIDAEKFKAFSKAMGVKGYPTVFLYNNGILVDQWAGDYEDKLPVIERINSKVKKR